VRALYTVTIFLGSALLFLVEPMVAKMILPVFGGSPAVWNAAVVFFQLMLLLGYAYAHGSVRLLGENRQPVLHLIIIAVALIALPFGIKPGYSPSVHGQPAFEVLGLLLVMVGLPFFAVAAQAPLIQRWFASTPDPRAHDPYFLYSASNLGSMLALLAYPAIIEPRLTLGGQSQLWMGGYIALGVLTLGSAIALYAQSKRVPAKSEIEEEKPKEPDVKPTNRNRVRWLLLSAAPASLMLGITTYLTTNVAPIPLLWVVPLAVYLLSFILAFSHRIHPNAKLLARISTMMVLPITLILVLELWTPMIPLAIMHLVVFLMLAWTCHLLLVRSRPSAAHLTEFYLWMAAGGVVGGAFNGFVAPLLFNSLIEYPIALALALALIQPGLTITKKSLFADLGVVAAAMIVLFVLSKTAPVYLSHQTVQIGESKESAVAMVIFALLTIACFFTIDRPLRYGMVVGALMIMGPSIKPDSLSEIYQVRDFFGVKLVLNQQGFHYLNHGTILHGMQNMAPGKRDEPLTYYNPNSPVGRVFKEFSGPKQKQSIAVVGLGTGTMAAYGHAGQQFTFYEIDPQVIQIANDPKLFTFLSDSKAKINIVQGDARLELAKAPSASYDIIFLDAFSSDAIPVHLLTTQAIEMYLTKLKPGGFLAFHTSNRYLDLPPVLARAAKFEHLRSIYLSMDIVGPEEEKRGWTISRWLLMGRTYNDFGNLSHQLMWQHMDMPVDGPIWTDDFSNVLSAFASQDG
jgi:SAM-dependent methyltransferase